MSLPNGQPSYSSFWATQMFQNMKLLIDVNIEELRGKLEDQLHQEIQSLTKKVLLWHEPNTETGTIQHCVSSDDEKSCCSQTKESCMPILSENKNEPSVGQQRFNATIAKLESEIQQSNESSQKKEKKTRKPRKVLAHDDRCCARVWNKGVGNSRCSLRRIGGDSSSIEASLCKKHAKKVKELKLDEQTKDAHRHAGWLGIHTESTGSSSGEVYERPLVYKDDDSIIRWRDIDIPRKNAKKKTVKSEEEISSQI